MDAREVSYPETHRLVSIEFSIPTVTLSELELDEAWTPIWRSCTESQMNERSPSREPALRSALASC